MTQSTRDRRPRAASVSGGWLLLLSLAVAALLYRPDALFAQSGSTGWSMPEDISAPHSTGSDLFGMMFCDPNQNLHILWGKSDESGSEIYYRTDAEGTLSAPTDVIATPDRLAVRLSAALTEPDAMLHLVWQNEHVGGVVFYSRVPLAEAGDARAWEAPGPLIPHANSAGLAADNSGGLYLIYSTSDAEGFGNTIYTMRSGDSGLTWGEPQLIYEALEEVASTVTAAWGSDAAGRIHVGISLRSREYGVHSELGYLRSLDGGKTWEPYQTIATQNAATPNVAALVPFIFGEDEIHLTWHDPRRLHMWSEDGGVTWSAPIEIVRLGAGFGGANYLAKDSAGTLRAVTSVANGVYVSMFSGTRWLAAEQIESRKMDPHGQRLVVCQGNHLHILYDDRVEEDTTVWYAHTVVNAPPIERGPVPTGSTEHSDMPAPPVVLQATAPAEPAGTPMPPLPPAAVIPPTASRGTALSLLFSTLPVIALTTAALVIRKVRGR